LQRIEAPANRRREPVEVTSARHRLITEPSRETDETTEPIDSARSFIRCTHRRIRRNSQNKQLA
jgi:hypothetical protein